jgi:hypothetical protein
LNRILSKEVSFPKALNEFPDGLHRLLAQVRTIGPHQGGVSQADSNADVQMEAKEDLGQLCR